MMNIKKVLIANRGEIAIRISRACNELGIGTVAVYTFEDRYSLHRYKADEAYQIGLDTEPLKPYLDIEAIIAIAKDCDADAIHPGYGFLSENATFARRCAAEGIIFVGPSPTVMEMLGDKVSAKEVAQKAAVPIIESSRGTLDVVAAALSEAWRIGYPLMLKAAAGGGGRGMRVVRNDVELEGAFASARNEALNAFGDGTVFLEKYIENPRHIEVQIVGDQHGNIRHLYERDCSVQRRFQKVVEVAPAANLLTETREQLYAYATGIAKEAGYDNVGTVEFLVDANGRVYFIEVNPRIQVEHTVTEMVTGIDLIKTQLYIASGYRLTDKQVSLDEQAAIPLNGYAIQCRITTEDPAEGFKPDYGTIITYRNAAGFGVRLDEGSAYPGMKVSPFFDSMLVKLSTHGNTLAEAAKRMDRALREFRIRGVKNNIGFLENLVTHPVFLAGEATVGFIAAHPELLKPAGRLDRGTKLLEFLGDISVNGNPDVKGQARPSRLDQPSMPATDVQAAYPKGTKDRLTELGPEGFCEWLFNEKRIHYTDTTLRDAHQSLLATRLRTYDMLKVAAGFAKAHPQLFSMEVWGGATFDVCLRFQLEDPWQRLAKLRKAIPNILLQMLIRGCNGVGYAAYPDNLIEAFVEKSWETGVDIFRIFDSLNWMENIAPCIEMVRKRTGGLAEGTLCYTGDILDPARTKYDLSYYVRMAKDLENAGAHILGIKDMSGLLKPYAAQELITALKDTVKIPIHLHTHDTSSLQTATYLKAIEAGVDVVDCALGALSGLTSQPNLNAVAEMMRFHRRENLFDMDSLNAYSDYWEHVRTYYAPFESGLKAGSAEVFQHEIPGGQYSNLKQQATALGLGDRIADIKHSYADANSLFGDIVKVTPSSKVVGDMAQYMVANNLSKDDVMTKGGSLSFPDSVVSFFRGDIGQPEGGFPAKLQRMVMKGQPAYTERPNVHLPPLDLEQDFKTFLREYGMDFVFTDYLSYKFYPKVFTEYAKAYRKYGDVSVVPTRYFLYGMEPGEETTIEIAKGKTLLVKLVSIGPSDTEGNCTVFFKLNGQTRNLEIHDASSNVVRKENKKVDIADGRQVGSPLQGMLSTVFVTVGDTVRVNQPLFIIEAMKMETTVTAAVEGRVKQVALATGTLVNTDDLVVEME
ncbi:pyruvate carboxylase [Parapedobacter pyrenivorans]|uniref:Pyruvate carboxylase n=1 Tax=Parapedobacter pyrenivorans TaxID=1305674 RepID=A0A917I2G7_9SPHI|nr:pyruvate carboxylase [Parapedobacter pyrenivorans]GGH03430.1 pyruvate carboxylase [Parapedobacter pyrenivorans]